MNGLKLFLSILILFGSVAWSEAPRRFAYLGLAGNGAGMGMFGHAFVLLTPIRGNFFEAKVYQYNIQVPPEFKLTVESALSVQSFPFRVYSDSGINFIHHYTSEDRAVYLYELKLDEQAVAKLSQNLEHDKIAREVATQTDYNLATNNCVTKIYEQINAVTTGEQKLIPYQPGGTSFYQISRETISLAIPLASPLILQNHPLVSSMEYFKPVSVTRFERLLEQQHLMRDLFRLCAVSDRDAAAFRLLGSNVDTASSEAYVSVLQETFASCALANETANADLTQVLDIIRYSAPNERVINAADQNLRLLFH